MTMLHRRWNVALEQLLFPCLFMRFVNRFSLLRVLELGQRTPQTRSKWPDLFRSVEMNDLTEERGAHLASLTSNNLKHESVWCSSGSYASFPAAAGQVQVEGHSQVPEALQLLSLDLARELPQSVLVPLARLLHTSFLRHTQRTTGSVLIRSGWNLSVGVGTL